VHDPLLAGISAILFDMDGVIVDSMPHHARAWRTVLGKHGLTLQDEDIFRREGMTGSSSVIDIFREKGINPPDNDELTNLQNLKDKIFEEANIPLSRHPGYYNPAEQLGLQARPCYRVFQAIGLSLNPS